MAEEAIFEFSVPGEVQVIKGSDDFSKKLLSLCDAQGEVFYVDHKGQHHYLAPMSRIAAAWVRWRGEGR